MTHSLGWPVIPQTILQRERWPGAVRGYEQVVPLVHRGQEVLPDQPVLRLEPGEMQEPFQGVARPSLPTAGGIDIHEIQGGQSGAVPLIVPAGLRGRVVDVTRRGGIVIESRAGRLQGMLGAGRQVAGVLTMWQRLADGRGPLVIPPGALLVVPGPLNITILSQAKRSGVAGIIASSMSLSDLEGFLRTDYLQLLVATDVEVAQAYLPDLTLLLTEGLGAIAMPARIIKFLSIYQGSIALLSGVTAIQSQLVPELIISLPEQKQGEIVEVVHPDKALNLGATVRVYIGEHIGSVGVIDYFFAYEQKFPSGIRDRALRIRREDGSLLVVPDTHVERIE